MVQPIKNTTECTIKTEKVARKDVRTVAKTIATWKKLSSLREKQAYETRSLEKNKCDLAVDSNITISLLNDELKTLQTNKELYIAKDARNTIQGAALITHFKKYAQLSYLVTHPNNLSIFGNEKPIRGAGTQLMNHIIRDLYERKKPHTYSCLKLDSLPSAVPFYRKMGFIDAPSNRKLQMLAPLRMQRSEMKEFISLH